MAAQETSQPRAFGREARLRCQSHLTTVRNQGRSQAGRTCVVNVLMPPPDGTKRAAFCISRHFSKLAVVRNRARRLFREVFRLLHPSLPPCWVLFIPRRQIRSAKMQDVLEDARGALTALGLSLPSQPLSEPPRKP